MVKKIWMILESNTVAIVYNAVEDDRASFPYQNEIHIMNC